MRLVVDASTLVAELLRARRRQLVAHPALDLLDLVVAAESLSETQHELRKRVALLVQHKHLDAESSQLLLDAALATVVARVTVVPSAVYADRMTEARRRVPRDPNDTPSVALALTLDCGIWTGDRDFFGCGVPVWTTETLLLELEARQTGENR